MKKLRINPWLIFVPVLLVFFACDPNRELYEQLDELKPPHNETFTYTLIEADYTRFAGFINQNKAFNDSLPAKEYIPDVLKVRFVTLREGSRAMVTYNHFLLHPDWWDAGFGYLLTDADYAFINIGNSFNENNPAYQFLPSFLWKLIDDPQPGQRKNLIYRFTAEGETRLDLDTYEFDGGDWILIETIIDIPYVGYEMQDEDYENFGGQVGQFKNFSSANSPDTHLPILLKSLFPFALAGDEQVIKYRYHDGSQVVNRIDKYHTDGVQWHKIPYIEERTEQYVFGPLGWAFDPDIVFQMAWEDYMYLAVIDPIPHETFTDFGYYYGASAFFRNFDIRLIGRRLNKDADGNYRDPELGAIYENEGAEAAEDEMMRRIAYDGIIKLLQNKFPDATPQVDGIDVHYFVNFETFADNWVRRYPQAEYICTEPGNPPQFELVTPP